MYFRQKKIEFDHPKVMGILNVTPDSFSDGGRFGHMQAALQQAQRMVQAGATFIDVGGESTRPGATPVSVQEELDRVVPVIEKITQDLDTIVSIDTSKPEVMQAAVDAGAGMINDVKALGVEGALAVASQLAKAHNVPVCLMHMRGSPADMQNAPEYQQVVDEVKVFLCHRLEACRAAGIKAQQLLVDPGFGFGKTVTHNYQLLKHLDVFKQLEVPVLVGMSRKSMIGDLLNKPVSERLSGSLALATIAAMSGANIIRVHDVEETMDVVRVVNKLVSVA